MSSYLLTAKYLTALLNAVDLGECKLRNFVLVLHEFFPLRFKVGSVRTVGRTEQDYPECCSHDEDRVDVRGSPVLTNSHGQCQQQMFPLRALWTLEAQVSCAKMPLRVIAEK